MHVPVFNVNLEMRPSPRKGKGEYRLINTTHQSRHRMKFVEPQVYLIGETKIDLAQLREMLGAIGGSTASEWFSKTQKASKSEGELLTEVAGRLCYKSFGVGLNPN